jgi:hypothetical protein
VDTEQKLLPAGALLLIGLFYSVIVVIAVLLLAAVQFRSVGGSGYATWRLTYKANRFLAHTQADDLAKQRKSYMDSADALAFTELCLGLYDAAGKHDPNIDPQVLEDVKAARQARIPYDKLDGLVRCVSRGFPSLKYDRSFFEVQKENAKKDLDDVVKAINANNEQLAELIKGQRDFLALKELEDRGTWYTKLIVVVPYSLLVLLLVMLMGALGGMVRLLRDYGDANRPNPTPSDYFVIPLIGLVVAIGGYVVSKTGLMLLSSTREDASLSPFMVALLGIVSGLLAKEVIDALARAGAKMVANAAPATGPPAGPAPGGASR